MGDGVVVLDAASFSVEVRSVSITSVPGQGGVHMVKRLLALLFVMVLVLPPSTLASAQEAMAKEGRWEGTVTRSNPDKSTITVRKIGSNLEKTVAYDSSTQWVSQEHASKKVT